VRLRTPWLLASGTLVAAACTAFGENAPELSPGPPDAAATDQETPDATAPERDALPEARACATGGHWICDDFDHDGGLERSWSVGQERDGSIFITPDPAAPSAPNVVLAIASSDERAAIVSTQYPVIHGLMCSFSVRVLSRGTADAILLAVSLYDGAVYYRISLNGFAAGGAAFVSLGSDGGTAAYGPLTMVPLPDGAWIRGSIRLAVGTADAGIELRFGTQAYSPAPAFDLANLPQSTTQSLDLGASIYPAGQATWRVSFDDIVCDPIP
jgi:hypothetical protein